MQPRNLGVPVTRDSVTSNSMYETELCTKFMSTGTCGYGGDCIYAHSSGDSSRRRNPLDRHKPVEITPEKGICRIFFYQGRCPYREKCIFEHQGLGKSKDNRDSPRENCAITIPLVDFEHQGLDKSTDNRDSPRENSAITIPLVDFEHQGLDKSTDNRDSPRENSAITIPLVDFDSNIDRWLKTRLCSDWMMRNSCAFGARCMYAHGQEELRKSSPSLGSEFRDTRNAPRTRKKKDTLPYNAGKQSDEQKVPPIVSLFERKTMKNIVGIYADWLDDN